VQAHESSRIGVSARRPKVTDTHAQHAGHLRLAAFAGCPLLDLALMTLHFS
jgi:hypothetical protein